MLKLTVVEGREAGRVFSSGETSVGIGAAPDNELQLADPYVSRHHGRVARVGDSWLYRDLGSTNGSVIKRHGADISFLDQASEVALEPDDLLCVGESVLRFTVTEAARPMPEHTIVAARRVEDLAASRERQLSDLEDLAAAYALEQQLAVAPGPEQMLDAVLAAMLAAFPSATHALLVLIDKRSGAPRRQVAWVRGEPARAATDVPISMSVANRVLQEGRSLLFVDVPTEFATSQSAAQAGITSSLCAPLWTGEETVGLIQLDSRSGRASFTERDLERLGLYANRAALAIVSSELHEAERRNQLVRDLSAMITHDLKGPLTSITGFLELLADEPPPGPQAEYVEIALASSRWLSVLIAAILDVAKMEAGGAQLRTEPVAVKQEIETALGLIGYQIREKGIALNLAMPADLPPVRADPELLRRIVVNLVGNSVKFAPEGSAITVSAALDSHARQLVVGVQDQGPGIAKEHQASIFDKFVQVAKGRTSEKISVGLGLAFCKLAVEAHGGTIGVESEPGHGARFWFSLPLAGPAGGES